MTVRTYVPTLQNLKDFKSREGKTVDHLKTVEGVSLMVDIGDIPSMCFFATVHPTCIELHAMFTEEAAKYPLIIQKSTKNMLKAAFDIFDTYNIFVMDIAKKDERWAESLGFKKGLNYDNLESMEGFTNYVLKRGES